MLHVQQPLSGGKVNDDPRLEYLLASMRLARANLQTYTLALDEIGVALKGNLISLDTACKELQEMDLLRWLPEKGGANDK